MKKIILTFTLLILFQVSAVAFEYPFYRGIIFNDVPFSPETAADYKRSFNRGEKIYWLFMSKKPIKASFIEVQVISASHKSGFTTLGGIAYTHDYRINRDSPYYFTDYFVIHTPGHYYMQIFDKNKIHAALTRADFFVK